MIYIEKQKRNKIILELSCLLPAIYEYFLFEFIYEGDTNRYSRYWYSTNLSGAKCRYDLFQLIENSTGTDSINNINPILLIPGQYKYNVYADVNPVDYNDITPFLNNGIISTGRMVVKGTTPFLDPVYDSQIINTNVPNVYL